ncbi:MAG: glycyl radical protein [bacterium]|nr:glycyl radical protein [bacterium]
MNDRVQRLRAVSLSGRPRISAERAQLITGFYGANGDSLSPAMMRAGAFHHLCERKSIHIGDDELIVGERGPAPLNVPTFPELTCHSVEDLRLLDGRERTSYAVDAETIAIYEEEIIPFWRKRNAREQIFADLPEEWRSAYEAGIFTEFMEQRAPGHTVADGKIFGKGMRAFQADIEKASARLADDPVALDRLAAMTVAADASIVFARRHAELATAMAASTADADRRAELERIAAICERVPAEPPRDFHEALQAYWFCHLGVITELNGWDAFSPGHLDQHLEPFYQAGLADGTLTRESAKELLECLFVKFNNHPAPPKVGVTAAESGTYTDFANINIGGVLRDGADGVSDVSYLLLEVIDELHILQPSSNVQISEKTPEEFLLTACGLIRRGYGYPSVFNSDVVVAEMLRQGKCLEDAREGGNSGCVETGAFGKEAYILTGYLNLPKLLELALHDGLDPRTGRQLGPQTGKVDDFVSYADLFNAWREQLRHFIEIKIRGNEVIAGFYAERMPAPFLSLLIDDCIASGRDYNEGGARYNTRYIQGVGIGTLTDSLAAIKKHIFDLKSVSLPELVTALDNDFAGEDSLRGLLMNRTPHWGNDRNYADDLMRTAFTAFFEAVDGRPSAGGGTYRINMLPTTCHVHFGAMTGATPEGRRAGAPFSEGISPVQGRDRRGPTAVVLSAAKMDHVKTGGTLLNMKFLPQVLEGAAGLSGLAGLIRGYFDLGGHHIQFNVVSADLLRAAQADPDTYRHLIVRVAGYSDYFCDLSTVLQDEIINRTEQC